jgi:hypothetical protein
MNILNINYFNRYLYALQIKRDLAEGLLLCSDATASLLVSYILQGKNNTKLFFFYYYFYFSILFYLKH